MGSRVLWRHAARFRGFWLVAGRAALGAGFALFSTAGPLHAADFVYEFEGTVSLIVSRQIPGKTVALGDRFVGRLEFSTDPVVDTNPGPDIEDGRLSAGSLYVDINGRRHEAVGQPVFYRACNGLCSSGGAVFSRDSITFRAEEPFQHGQILSIGFEAPNQHGGQLPTLSAWGPLPQFYSDSNFLFASQNGPGPLDAFPGTAFRGRIESLRLLPGCINDVDCDGLLDSWEISGFDFDCDETPDVDLPGLGAQHDRRDLFVRVDWLEETGDEAGISAHSHEPKIDGRQMQKVKDAFAAQGIALHLIRGRAIDETPQNRLLEFSSSPFDFGDFDEARTPVASPEEEPVFHNALFAHDAHLDGTERGGVSPIPGSRFVVTATGWWEYFSITPFELITPSRAEAGNFMHELGHNLGLGHGGLDSINYKPNHLSVMNYSFSPRGLRKRGYLGLYRDGHFDYSTFSPADLPDLIESDLDEALGLNAAATATEYGTYYYCPGATEATRGVDGLQQAVDWNCDGLNTSEHLAADINNFEKTQNPLVPTQLAILSTVDEWQHLEFRAGSIGQFPGCPGQLSRALRHHAGETVVHGAPSFESDLANRPFELVGDFDQDGDVDDDDIEIFLPHRGELTDESACGDLCDFDQDGMITALDARRLTLLCTRNRCATEMEALGVMCGLGWEVTPLLVAIVCVRQKRRFQHREVARR